MNRKSKMAPNRPNPTLTEDLISEILIRLPVKSLVCFQLVSKAWLSLIKDPAFVKSQLLRTVLTHETQNLILQRIDIARSRSGFIKSKPEPENTLNIAPSEFSLLGANSRQIVADLTSPYPQGEFKYGSRNRLVGSANGIVCVFTTDFQGPQSKTSGYLWNPATRQSKVIPHSGVCDDREVKYAGMGFGYDQIDQDFKVFRFVKSSGAEVYSENHKAWRKVPGAIDVPFRDFEVCVNGFLCGIGLLGMMAFDLNKEVLNCAIKLPLNHVGNKTPFVEYIRTRLVEYNKSLAATRVDEKISIWMLNDGESLGGGVEALWTQMVSIEMVWLDFNVPRNIVLGCISNGDLLLLMKDDYNHYIWISCNVDKKEAKIVPLLVDMAGKFYPHHACKYTESLVSLAGFKQVNLNASEDDN